MQRKSSLDLNGLIGSLKTDLPTIEVKHYALAGSGLARIVANVFHTAASRANPALVLQAIRAKLDNKMAAVAGSFHSVEKGPVTEVLSGLVSVIRESKAIGEGSDMTGFKAYASNMFLDNEGDIWSLKKTEAGSILVRSSGIEDDESLIKVLKACCSSAVTRSESAAMTAHASAVVSKVEAGNYVSFVDSNDIIKQGFVVATTDEGQAVVLSSATAAEEVVPLETITQIHDQSEFPEVALNEQEQTNIAVATARGAVDLSMMLEYYKKIYSSDPKFYEMFAERIRAHSYA